MRQNWRKELATARWQLAQTLDRLKRREEAFLQARQSLELLDSAQARITLGDLMLGAGDRNGAMQEYQRALSSAEARVAEKPRMMPWRNELADIYERIARWHERAGDFLRASTWQKKSLAIWKEWPKWGVSSSYDQQRLRQAGKAVTTCDTKCKKSERTTSAVPLG
jgi:tetratricopeptide (TPR) repeat protein